MSTVKCLTPECTSEREQDHHGPYRCFSCKMKKMRETTRQWHKDHPEEKKKGAIIKKIKS